MKFPLLALLLIAFAPSPVAMVATSQAQTPTKPVAERISGDWELKNAKGTTISAMQIRETQSGTFELVRLGGGALAVSGEYRLEGTKLVKVPKPNDAYSDLTWHLAFKRFKLKDGDYKGWTLSRKK